jgi:hypothetical protein
VKHNSIKHINEQQEKEKRKEKLECFFVINSLTTDGNIRNAVLAKNVNSIGNDTIERLANHGKISRVLKELKSRRVHIKPIFHEKVYSHPW